MRTIFWALALLAVSTPVYAQAALGGVGIEEHLGETIDLGRFRFNDEEGNPIALSTLFDRPIVLTLVYFLCPGICTPVLQEVAAAVDKSDLKPGIDYRAVTVSFEPKETAELAKNKKTNMLATLEHNPMPDDGWRFLTGDQENISALANAVGFKYARDKNGVDYVHSGTVIFLSPSGEIVRYLNGLSINPADFKMAVFDARQGLPRNIIQSVQRLCYSYDPSSQSYVLKINRIILGVTIVFALGFVAYLVLQRPVRVPIPELSSPPSTKPLSGDAS